MQRRHWLLIGSVMITAFVGMGLADTPDGETPANEGICDELLGGTPGLYGICVAFCEVQDCDPDYDAVDPFASCKPASPKILEKYIEKMLPGDPEMPCVASACSCFSADELFAIPATEGAQTYASCTPTSIRSFPSDGSGGSLDYSAQVVLGDTNNVCSYAEPGIMRIFFISDAEANLCKTMIQTAQDDPAVSCP